MADEINYKRSMVTLFHTFTNERVDILDQDRFLCLYSQHEADIMERRSKYELCANLEDLIAKYGKNLKTTSTVRSHKLQDSNATFMILTACCKDKMRI